MNYTRSTGHVSGLAALTLDAIHCQGNNKAEDATLHTAASRWYFPRP